MGRIQNPKAELWATALFNLLHGENLKKWCLMLFEPPCGQPAPLPFITGKFSRILNKYAPFSIVFIKMKHSNKKNNKR